MLIKSIRDIVAGRALFRINAGATVREACDVMLAHDIGALVVLRDETLVGILSERDVVRRGVCAGLDMETARVADIMTPDPVKVEMDDPLSEALAARVGGAFRHLPVTENGAVVGILSFRDIPAEYRLMFERFEEYTHSAPS